MGFPVYFAVVVTYVAICTQPNPLLPERQSHKHTYLYINMAYTLHKPKSHLKAGRNKWPLIYY